jgi:GT2 family glycosyltransferase
MVESIDHDVDHLIVIDNGGCVDPKRVDWVGHVQRFSLIPIPRNLGVAGSWNLGIKVSPFAPWWLVANFDVVWPAGSLKQFGEQARVDALLLSGGSPPWCAFAVGERVIDRVGLFDERLHPAYFEDNDFQSRVELAGFGVVESRIPVEHENSSTLKAGFQSRNDVTFADNMRFYVDKAQRKDLSWGWSLDRRRRLTWD